MAVYQLVSFVINKEEFAIEIDNVSGIIKYKNYTISKIPNSPKELEGLINLRGKVTPVYNMKKKFGYSNTSINSDSKIITINNDDSIIGFVVDDVTDIYKLKDEDIEPFPSSFGSDCSYINGIGKMEGNMIVIIDLLKSLSKKDMSQLQSLKSISV